MTALQSHRQEAVEHRPLAIHRTPEIAQANAGAPGRVAVHHVQPVGTSQGVRHLAHDRIGPVFERGRLPGHRQRGADLGVVGLERRRAHVVETRRRLPLVPDRGGRAHRDRAVDDAASAEHVALQERRPIAARELDVSETRRHVERLEREVFRRTERSALDEDDVEAGGGEGPRRHCPAWTRADHADVVAAAQHLVGSAAELSCAVNPAPVRLGERTHHVRPPGLSMSAKDRGSPHTHSRHNDARARDAFCISTNLDVRPRSTTCSPP
jgi:hypothetical protein